MTHKTTMEVVRDARDKLALIIPDIIVYGLKDDKAQEMWLLEKINTFISDNFRYISDFKTFYEWMGIDWSPITSNTAYEKGISFDLFLPIYFAQQQGKDILDHICNNLFQLEMEDMEKEDNSIFDEEGEFSDGKNINKGECGFSGNACQS